MFAPNASIRQCLGLLLCGIILAGCGGSSNETPGQAPGPSGTNAAPTISGTPAATVALGADYSFTPTAQDADGDPLTFAITNKPAWANIDVTTGALTGVPATTGDFGDISISVSDGAASTTLASFGISVTADASSTAILSWTAPSTRTDASALPLSEIAGFRIYRGDSADRLSRIAEIDDGTITSHTVNKLPAGTHYFAVTVYDTEDNESAYSKILSRTTP